MGIGDFFKNIFGKKTCAFCGGECGVMSRTKIKGDEYICSKCDDNCSNFVRKSRFTKEELAGHMEYIKRLDRVFNEVILPGVSRREYVPSPLLKQGFEFFDEFGMFRITDRNRDSNDRYPVELIRYDTVASWEPYWEESEPEEQGGEKQFEECGVKLRLVGVKDDVANIRYGTRAHPYIIDEITVCFTNNDKDKERMKYAIEQAIAHFNMIFGVHDDEKGLFSFGMSTKEKRDLMGAVAFTKTAFEAVKTAKNGGEMTEEKMADIQQNMNTVADAATGGLSEYTRRADAAEAKIN